MYNFYYKNIYDKITHIKVTDIYFSENEKFVIGKENTLIKIVVPFSKFVQFIKI